MRLDFFLLADAVAISDGKLYVHGGGVTKLTPPFLPWVQPQLAVLVRFRIDGPEDMSGKHEFTLTLLGPGGEEVVPALVSTLDFASKATEVTSAVEGEERFGLVSVNLLGVVFSEAGVYELGVRLDDEPVARMTLPVVAPPVA